MKEHYKDTDNKPEEVVSSEKYSEVQEIPRQTEHNHSKEKEHRIEQAEEKLEQSIDDNQEKLNPLEKLDKVEHESAKKNESLPVSEELYRIAAQRTIIHIQKTLPYFKRNLSKVIHTPVINNISEVASKTIGRTSGLLGGGITAFLGTLVYLFIAGHNGFRYNYMVSILLACSGFIIGVTIEFLIVQLFQKNTKRISS